MNSLTTLASSGIIAYTLNLLLHLTVISLGVLCAARLAFRRDPAARHLLCLIGLVGLLLTPALVGLETKAGAGLFKLALPGAAAVPSAPEEAPLTLSASDKPYRVSISPIAAVEPPPPNPWGVWAISAVYFSGVLWGAVRFAHGCRRVLRIKRHLSPWQEPTADATLHAVAQRLHAPAPPIFTSRYIASPVAVGLLRPAVILPEGLAETLTPRQLRHVLLHECAHVTFRHGLGGLLERIVGVLFWPHPLVRLLCRELDCAREEMCDNVASQEDGAACYARTLLLIAQGIDRAPKLASSLALLGTGTSLEARIAGLLHPQRNRMVSIKRWKLWAVTGASACILASTAAVRVVAAQDQGNQQTPGGVPTKIALTRVFALQYTDATQAAEFLQSALAAQQQPPIHMVVDKRTNSLVVQCPGGQMVGVAALLGQLEIEAQDAEAQTKTPATTVPTIPCVPANLIQPIPTQPSVPARTVSAPQGSSSRVQSPAAQAAKTTASTTKKVTAAAQKSALKTSATAKKAHLNVAPTNTAQDITRYYAKVELMRKVEAEARDKANVLVERDANERIAKLDLLQAELRIKLDHDRELKSRLDKQVDQQTVDIARKLSDDEKLQLDLKAGKLYLNATDLRTREVKTLTGERRINATVLDTKETKVRYRADLQLSDTSTDAPKYHVVLGKPVLTPDTNASQKEKEAFRVKLDMEDKVRAYQRTKQASDRALANAQQDTAQELIKLIQDKQNREAKARLQQKTQGSHTP